MANLTDEHRTLAAALNTHIRANPSWYTAVASRQPHWYGALLTDLMLAIADEVLVYLTARFDHDTHAGTIVVFTPLSRIVATVSTNNEDEARVEVTVRSRHGLQSIKPHGTESIFETDAFTDWPGRIETSIEYFDGSSLLIPLEWPTEERRRKELFDLLASLRLDLHRSSHE